MENQFSLDLVFALRKEEPENPIPAEQTLPEKEMVECVEDINRDEIFDSYKPLGQTVKLENDRGLPDMHRRRAANFQQFFTPFSIVRFLTEAQALDGTALVTGVPYGAFFQRNRYSSHRCSLEIPRPSLLGVGPPVDWPAPSLQAVYAFQAPLWGSSSTRGHSR